jgi:cellulose synthase/poly-beta-1,6-N-acetylglucosamine synthase-like glycosyltransferase
LRVLHITELPPGWLGKTHAMASAAALALTDFLLFTDGDILFRPDAIRRTLASAVASNADHLVLAPTAVIRRWDEAMLTSFFQMCGLLSVPVWKVADPNSRASIGIGAFNLIRRDAYLQIGGFDSMRMEIVEDLGLGRRVKQARLGQRFVAGHNLAQVHWAAGARGIIGVMTKNIFAVYRFRLWFALAGCMALTTCILPFLAVWFRPFTIPSALIIAAFFLSYRAVGRITGISAWNALLAPFAAALLAFAMLRSVVTTLRQGGVLWRGTFYPLAELREHATPIIPRRSQ